MSSGLHTLSKLFSKLFCIFQYLYFEFRHFFLVYFLQFIPFWHEQYVTFVLPISEWPLKIGFTVNSKNS